VIDEARKGRAEHDHAMAHRLIKSPAGEVVVQPGAVVSRVVHRGDGLDVTVFGFDTGEQLTEHTSPRAAVIQVLSGRLRFVVDGEQIDLTDGSWLHMSPGAPHSLEAIEPTVMMLTLIGA
jgi:quercetin dioxygenase-like cupin family protein